MEEVIRQELSSIAHLFKEIKDAKVFMLDKTPTGVESPCYYFPVPVSSMRRLTASSFAERKTIYAKVFAKTSSEANLIANNILLELYRRNNLITLIDKDGDELDANIYILEATSFELQTEPNSNYIVEIQLTWETRYGRELPTYQKIQKIYSSTNFSLPIKVK